MRILIIFLAVGMLIEPGTTSVPWSRQPPGGLKVKDVPQFVSITFDDNFGLAHPGAEGGINYIVDFYKTKKNPAGAGNPANFDGAPIAASFYHTSIYVVDPSKKVIGGKQGEDNMGRNRTAWSTAVKAGHEAGNHTVNHFNGGIAQLTEENWGKPLNWSADEWGAEIKSCKETLSGPDGIGVRPEDVIGFRTPFLAYNDHVFTALRNLRFTYDTSLPNCFDDLEDGTNCSWPYTLDQGSPDIDVMARKFSFPKVTTHPGLWEAPPTTLIIPPDTAANRYGFSPGLRTRISKKAPLPYPSVYETSTGKIAGLDYTLLVDAGLSGMEMSAVLKYNLDLHLSGNRSPIIFIAHSHLYTFSSPEDNPGTPSAAVRDERWKGLTEFINYALSKPETRIVSTRNIISWMQKSSASIAHCSALVKPPCW